jgi:hypothetical protein
MCTASGTHPALPEGETGRENVKMRSVTEGERAQYPQAKRQLTNLKTRGFQSQTEKTK